MVLDRYAAGPAVVLAAFVLAGCGAMSGAGTSATETRPAGAERNRALVRDAFERWSAGTGGPFDLLAEDATWTITGSSPMSRTYGSRQAFMDEVIRPFNARVRSPLKPTIRELCADGETVVILFDGATVAKDGVPYVNTYLWHLTFRDGRVVRATALFDTRRFDDLWTRVAPTP